MKKPKGILFDFGDTILHEVEFEPEKGNHYLFSIIEDKKHVKYDELLGRIKKLNEEIYPKKNAIHFEVSWIAFNKLIFEYFDLKLPISNEEAEFEFWKRADNWTPAPKIFETLDYIKHENIPMGILSNTAFSGKTLERELEKQGLKDYFEFVMASSDYGLRKPHPYFFNLAASKIGAKPNEIWFIGDNIDLDIEGSQNVGMTPFHYIGKTCKTHLPENRIIRCWDNMVEILNQAMD